MTMLGLPVLPKMVSKTTSTNTTVIFIVIIITTTWQSW